MNETEWDEFEPDQARLRGLVEGVDRQIAEAFSGGVAAQASEGEAAASSRR